MRKVAANCCLLPLEIPAILVSGTNGKGSTVAILRSILRAQRYRTGSYTSPHLLRYNERVCIDETAVEDYLLCEAFDFIDRKRYGVSLSFFEFGTLAALYCFRRFPLDVVILEVGLGGRLDAVNIVDPRRIGDHQHRHRPCQMAGARPRGDRIRESRHHATTQAGGVW